MNRKIFSVLMLLFVSLAACSGLQQTEVLPPSPTIRQPTATPEAPVWPREFTDDLGRTIALEAPPEAIITLGASLLESLFAIGAGNLIVGRDDTSTFPEEALEITDIGSLFGELPIEAILALEPDLVLAPEIISTEQVSALEEVGLTVYWQQNPTDFDGLYTNLKVLGGLTNHESDSVAVISDLQQRVDAVLEALKGAQEEPLVFYELDATDPQSPWTSGQGTFIDTVIVMAGGVNIGAALEDQYAQISSEELLAQDPDIILLSDALYGITPESVTARAGWESMTAVQNGQIYPFDPFLLSVPGPRLVDGLEEMARLLHPGLAP